MSHFVERTEKNCLNCGSTVVGRYCHQCGQENIEPRETFLHLLKHLIAHEFHYDGKFISTVKLLFTRPGYLSVEYLNGKRASFLDPIRMYIFLSAFFFLIMFSLNKEHEKVGEQPANAHNAASAHAEIPHNETQQHQSSVIHLPNHQIDSLETGKATLDIDMGDTLTSSVYIHQQAALPKEKKDHAIKYYIKKLILSKQEMIRKDPNSFFKHIIEELKHESSEILFVSLPFFAFLLYMLYWRSRKNYYYVQHFIYTLHLYCAAFIILLAMNLIDYISEWKYLHWMGILELLLFIYWMYYNYKSLRVFYKQSRRKTLSKYALLYLGAIFLMVGLYFVFGIWAVVKA